jgi:hypothetical protein
MEAWIGGEAFVEFPDGASAHEAIMPFDSPEERRHKEIINRLDILIDLKRGSK